MGSGEWGVVVLFSCWFCFDGDVCNWTLSLNLRRLCQRMRLRCEEMCVGIYGIDMTKIRGLLPLVFFQDEKELRASYFQISGSLLGWSARNRLTMLSKYNAFQCRLIERRYPRRLSILLLKLEQDEISAKREFSHKRICASMDGHNSSLSSLCSVSVSTLCL